MRMRSAEANFATGSSGSLTQCASMPSGEPPAPRTSEPAGACVSSCRRSWTWARLQPASLKIRPCSGPTSSIASNARRRRGVATFSSAIASDAHSPSGSDRKSTRLNSSHVEISYAVFCLKKKKKKNNDKAENNKGGNSNKKHEVKRRRHDPTINESKIE